jgi:hypothetical protein
MAASVVIPELYPLDPKKRGFSPFTKGARARVDAVPKSRPTRPTRPAEARTRAGRVPA